MKSYIHFLKNEGGFFLPLVLVVSMITLSALITMAQIYKNELEATNLLIQHLDLSTHKEIVVQRFKEEVNYTGEESGEFHFKILDYDCYGEYETIDEEVRLHYLIETENLSNYYVYSFLIEEIDE